MSSDKLVSKQSTKELVKYISCGRHLVFAWWLMLKNRHPSPLLLWYCLRRICRRQNRWEWMTVWLVIEKSGREFGNDMKLRPELQARWSCSSVNIAVGHRRRCCQSIWYVCIEQRPEGRQYYGCVNQIWWMLRSPHWGPSYMVSGTRDNPPPELPWPR